MLLDHLAATGFGGAPRPLGRDEQGREVLSWIEGDVGVPPFPDWVADDGLLVSVASLQRQMHTAARTFRPPADAVWDTANLPPAGPDALVCHNDLCVENVVVRDGAAVGVIDFDFAAPSHPLVDIAIAARHWIPVRDDRDIDDPRRDADRIARWRMFTDVHDLTTADRAEVAAQLGEYLDKALVSMKARADAGNPIYRAVWDAGYADQNRRSRAWLDANAADLVS
jgi:thiamine kinase-like enzyme